MPRWAAALLALFLPAMATATDVDARFAAIEGLGTLNGVALQCKDLDQVRRMKTAVIANAPKERTFGLAFDHATNDAFLAFIKNDETCPTHSALARQVGHQIDRLTETFAAP